MLSKGAIKQIHTSIDELFARAKTRLLGHKTRDRQIKVSFNHDLSLPGLYDAAARDDGAAPREDTIDSITSIAEGYLDAQKARTKAQVVKDVTSFLSDARAAGVETDVETVLGGSLTETWGKITSDVKRIVESETQNGRAYGALEGLTLINAQHGIEDPTVAWVVVRDGHTCSECFRLHMLPDGVTPRVWKLSEVSNAYHKKGEDMPSISGLHPRCRCAIVSCMPGFGFNPSGQITYIAPGHDEYARQRGMTKSEHIVSILAKSGKTPEELMSALERKHFRQDRLPSPKGTALQIIKETTGIDDHDSAQADVLWRRYKAKQGPKPKPWAGGELDGFKGNGKDNFTSLQEAFEHSTRGIHTWRDLNYHVLPKLRQFPGFENARIPEEIGTKHLLQDEEKKILDESLNSPSQTDSNWLPDWVTDSHEQEDEPSHLHEDEHGHG